MPLDEQQKIVTDLQKKNHLIFILLPCAYPIFIYILSVSSKYIFVRTVKLCLITLSLSLSYILA